MNSIPDTTFSLNNVQPRGRDLGSESQKCISISRGANAPSAGDEFICPITFEPIGLFPQEDIFTTRAGIPYFQPSLKQWLQQADTMPHNGVKEPDEILRLWPLAEVPTAASEKTLVDLRNTAIDLQCATVGGVFGSAAFLSAALHLFMLPPPSGSVDGNKSHVWQAGIFLSLGVGLAIASYNVRNAKNVVLGAIAGIKDNVSNRPMTAEECEKAAMGLEYYKDGPKI